MGILNFYKNSSKLFLFDESSFSELKENETTKNAIYAFLVLSAVNAFFSGLITYWGTSSLVPLPLIVLKAIIGLTLVSFVAVAFVTAIIHVILQLFKGTGSYGDSLKFVVASSVVSTIVISIAGYIVQMVYRTTDFADMTYGAKDLFFIILYALVVLIFTIWNIVVMIKSLSKVHELSVGKVVGAFVIVFVIGMVLAGIAIGLLLWMFSSLAVVA